MDHPLETLIDRQVRAALTKGELDNLPGEGKPMDLSPGRPSVAETMMKANQVTPPGVAIRKEVQDLRSKLARTSDPENPALMKQIADLDLRVTLELESLRRFG